MSAPSHEASREQRIKWSMGASILARAAGAGVQIISLPIAAQALGHGGFVLYAMAMAMLGWLMIANFGIGPAVSNRLAFSLGRSDDGAVRELFATGAALTALLVLPCALLIGGVFALVPASFTLFPSGGSADDVPQVIQIVLMLFILWSGLSYVEYVQLAHQERYRFDLALLVGSMIAAVAVFIVAKAAPSPATILLAAHLPVTAARLVNATLFLTGRRSLLAGAFAWKLGKRLFGEGVSMSTAASLNHFLAHYFPILLLGSSLRAADAASMAAVMNAVVIFSSFFTIANTPLRGAFPEARARGELGWIRKALRRALSINVGGALVILLLLVTAGETIFGLWYGNSVSPDRFTLIWAGIYFVALGFEASFYILLCAWERVGSASLLLAGRAVAAAVIIASMADVITPTEVFAVLALTTVTLSLFPLGLRVARALA